MTLAEILSPDRIRLNVDAGSKKRALEALSELISQADPTLSSRSVCDCLTAREKLGSTGLGFGVAIPHGKLKVLEGTIGAFVRVRHGVDFDAPDGQPVDLLFGLLVPEDVTEEHLELLAQLAERFNDEDFRDGLREHLSPREAYDRFCQGATQT